MRCIARSRVPPKREIESDPALNVYSEAKSEYMFQLTSHLTPAYFAFYIDLLERSKKEMEAEPKRQLWQFQNHLAEIEDWNMERVAREVAGIQQRANCDFLEDLLTAVFIAHTKVLTAIRLNARKQKVQITVPKIEHFLLKVFCESAKLLWQSAYLFRENVGGIEKQQNYRQIQGIIENGIRTAIRAMIPVKSLLKDCVHAADDSDSDSSSDEEEAAAPEPAPVPAAPKPDSVVTEEIHPVVAALLQPVEEPPKVEEEQVKLVEEVKAVEQVKLVEEPPKVDASPLIVVDAEPRVEFSDYETIFDTEDADGNLIQPTQFHEGKNYDEEPSLEILDDVGTPLGDGDCDAEEQSSKLDYEEL